MGKQANWRQRKRKCSPLPVAVGVTARSGSLGEAFSALTGGDTFLLNPRRTEDLQRNIQSDYWRTQV